MIVSVMQFMITIILAIVCGQALGLSEGNWSLISLLVPALWMLPRSGNAGLVLLIGLLTYGFTLSYQPAALSVSMWVIFPLLMVAFSAPRHKGVMVICGLILLTLQVGIMTTQSAGKLGGTPTMTLLQILSVSAIWWAVNSWKQSASAARHWWALLLLLPLWIAEFTFAVVISLCVTGLMAIINKLVKQRAQHWSMLLCWTLPTVAFMGIVLAPAIEVPKPVFVVWLCLLATAWMTDYLLKSSEEQIE